MSEVRQFPVFPTTGLAQTGEFVKLVPEIGSRTDVMFIQLGQGEVLTKYIFGKTAVEGYSIGQISAQGDSDIILVADMQPNREHIFQARFGIFGPCQFYLWIPSTRQIGGLDNRPNLGSTYRELGYYDQFSAPPHKMKAITERWYNYDYYPAFKIFNPTNTPQSPEVIFKGMMFEQHEVEDQVILGMLEKGQIPYRVANLSGIEHRKPS